MLISTGLTVIIVLLLLMLIATVYILAYLRLNYVASLPVTGVVLIALQVVNLTILLQHIVGFEGYFLAVAGDYTLILIGQALFVVLAPVYFVRLFRNVQGQRLKLPTLSSVRETIDFLPGGISFSTSQGIPILTNYRMNELAHRLTGHTIMNALHTWEELRQIISVAGGAQVEDLWARAPLPGENTAESLYFSLPDGNIWRFRKEELREQQPHYLQLEAVEISDLYRYSQELIENNRMLAQQHQRQKSLIENIVEINREKEILATKMRIHDDLGRSIIATKRHMQNQTLADNLSYLKETWRNTISRLSDFSSIDQDLEVSPEIELQKVAGMIGCRIDFQGPRPTERKTALLFYAVVREALTNAVLHAKASRLQVTVKPTAYGYKAEISDNGTTPVTALTEGNGLGNLRRRLEQEGATLRIEAGEGVKLIAEIPAV